MYVLNCSDHGSLPGVFRSRWLLRLGVSHLQLAPLPSQLLHLSQVLVCSYCQIILCSSMNSILAPRLTAQNINQHVWVLIPCLPGCWTHHPLYKLLASSLWVLRPCLPALWAHPLPCKLVCLSSTSTSFFLAPVFHLPPHLSRPSALQCLSSASIPSFLAPALCLPPHLSRPPALCFITSVSPHLSWPPAHQLPCPPCLNQHAGTTVIRFKNSLKVWQVRIVWKRFWYLRGC